jgi:hypothetical protein
MHRFVLAIALVCLTGTVGMGQDPVKVDPKHYKLVSENAEVRILRFQYGPHEKSVMHTRTPTWWSFTSRICLSK